MARGPRATMLPFVFLHDQTWASDHVEKSGTWSDAPSEPCARFF